MSTTLKLIATFGIVFFGAIFSLTFLSPEKIETSAKSFVKNQIIKEVRSVRQFIKESSAAEVALNIASKLGLEKQQIQMDLNNNLPEKIANIIASMCSYECEKKKNLAKSITSSYLDRIKNIQIAENTLGNIVKGKYLEIVGNLKRDLRIFLGSNLIMFLALLAISFLKPEAVKHLFLPCLLLVVATIISSGIYLFGQDWFYTILYNDYMGFGYLLYIAIIFGFLIDITFNKAKVTTEIINGIANAMGSAFSVLPC